MLHERDSLSLYGVGYDAAGLPVFKRKSPERPAQLFMVVTVDFRDTPSKTSPFVHKRLGRDCVWHWLQALDLVGVDDRNKTIKAVVCGKQNGFPVGAFVAFAVTQHDE